MIDERVVAALKHKDAAVRKKAITMLGKSNDRAALPYLAQVYRADPDPTLRELAKKAGAYLQKNAPEEVSKIPKIDEIDTGVSAVSGVSEQRAKSAIEQAMKYNVAGDYENTKAALQKAFKLDPRLRRDGYARGLAAQVMQMRDEDEAIRELMREQVKITSGNENDSLPMIALIMIGGAMMAIGFFLVWFKSPDITGMSIAGGEQSVASSGMDILQDVDGAAQILSAIEVGLSSGASVTMDNRSITSYSPVLTLIAGISQVIIGVGVFLGSRPKSWYWIQSLAFAAAGATGLLWLYTTINDLTSIGLGLLGSTTDWLGIGFWISSAGAAVVMVSAAIFAFSGNDKK